MATTDTTVNNLIINTLTAEQYATITPSETELYMVTDEVITASDVTAALGYTPRNTYSTTNPALTASQGKCTWTITHNLNSQNIQVSIFDTSTNNTILFDSSITSANVISVELISTSNISAGSYKVIVSG